MYCDFHIKIFISESYNKLNKLRQDKNVGNVEEFKFSKMHGS